MCVASSVHGTAKIKSHAIMQLLRNREGLRRSLIVYRFCAHPIFSAASILFCTENLSSFFGFFRHSFGPVPGVFRYLSVSFCFFRYLSVSFGIFRYLSVSFGIFRYLSVSFGIFRYLLVEFAMLYIEFEGEKPCCNKIQRVLEGDSRMTDAKKGSRYEVPKTTCLD